MVLPTSLTSKMKIFIFSSIALLSCNVMLSALNYQQNKQLKALEVSTSQNTDLLILESNPDYFTSTDFPSTMKTNCADE
tara:strand:+ start:1656 stop:1892 length:237 start_codon:yes stop_codon:yes gene_type:complete